MERGCRDASQAGRLGRRRRGGAGLADEPATEPGEHEGGGSRQQARRGADRIGRGLPDAVGYLYAVNGKISGGDIYASPLLFRKLWPRLLEASVTEAVAERSGSSAGSGLAIDDAAAFLTAMDSAAATDQQLPAGVTLMSRETEKAAAFETRSDAAEGWLHRSYIVK